MAVVGFTVNTYEVLDDDGVVHNIVARWMFQEAGCLTFRTGEKGRSEVVAVFAPGKWSRVKRKEED